MPLKEEHDVFDLLLLDPALFDALDPDLTDPRNIQQAVGFLLDDVQRVRAEGPDDPGRELGADPLDQPAAEAPVPVPEQAEVPKQPSSSIQAGAAPLFTRSKPRVGLLILFLLFAVPITLACICLLLLPAALTLGAGLFAGAVGVTGLTATFGGFTVFADILLVFGSTLIVLALALLFLWLFIWLIGGVIPALIRGVCALARKWCYKEVPVA